MKIITYISLVLLQIVPAIAEEHGHAAEGGHHEVDLTWPWINFALYVGLLAYVLRGPVKQMWGTRREFLIGLHQKGAVELKNSQARLSEAKKKMNAVDVEAKLLEDSILKDAEHESSLLLTEAKQRADRILKQSEESVKAEQRSAEILMRRELADKVLVRAKEKLTRELTAENDRQNRKATLAGVSQLVQ